MDAKAEWAIIEKMMVGDFDPDQPRDENGRWADMGKNPDTELSDDERRAIRRYTGTPDITPAESALIESAIKKSDPLEDGVDYSRGMALTVEELDDLLSKGVYAPGRLSSWSMNAHSAEDYAVDNAAMRDKIPVVLFYRGSKMLKRGMDVTSLSQHPEDDEALFSSTIRMRVEKNEVFGYDVGGDAPNDTVYINLYD